MANFKLSGVDIIIEQLSDLGGNIGTAAKNAINAAAPKMKESLSRSIEQAANRGYATGTLAGSIVATEAKEGKGGYYAEVKASGKDKKGTRNAEKLAYLEHGTSRQTARPVMRKAIDGAKDECMQIMQEKIAEAIRMG